MTKLRIEHVAGPYFVHPCEDLTREPEFPGDPAEFGIVHWEVWKNPGKTAHGDWSYDYAEIYETEVEARAVAKRLADADSKQP